MIQLPFPVEALMDYAPVLVFLGLILVLATVMFAIPALCARYRPSREKLSSYECGFEPFGDSRASFDVRFYLVAILFIIFDLEVIFLFPWSVALRDIGPWGFWSMMFFLLVLTIGFAYEWTQGALEWE